MNSPIRWYGGKGHLTQHLLKHVPPHRTYVEPFGGGASLLFAKTPSKVEVYNDIDSLLVNFFRVLRYQPQRFCELARLMPYSREEHKETKEVLLAGGQRAGVDPLKKAVMFFILCRQSMSGDLNGGWSYGVTTNCVNSWLSAIQKLPEVVHRFRQVQVEHGPALEVIKRYDTAETFFYLDPPYYPTSRKKGRQRVKYRYELTSWQHEELLELIREVKGTVLLSGYRCILYEQKLEDWHHEDIHTVSQATGTTRASGITGEGALKEKHKRVEVLWWNENLQKAMAAEEMPLFNIGGAENDQKA